MTDSATSGTMLEAAGLLGLPGMQLTRRVRTGTLRPLRLAPQSEERKKVHPQDSGMSLYRLSSSLVYCVRRGATERRDYYVSS